MAEYNYRAQDKNGRHIKGVMSASGEIELQRKLKDQNCLLLSARPVITKTAGAFSAVLTARFCRDMGNLINSGIPLVKALKIVSEQENISEKEKKVYARLMELVRKGLTLSDAMDEQEGVFPGLLVSILRSAEVGGRMGDSLIQMAQHFEKQHQLESKISNALVYPRILAVLVVAVVMIIMAFVIPRFSAIFAQMDSLPWATTVLINTANFIKKYFLGVIFAMAAFVILIRLLMELPRVKYFFHRLILKLPVAGNLLSAVYTARFARTLSSLYAAGINIVQALKVALGTTGNCYISAQLQNILEDLGRGESLSASIDKVDGISKKLISSIRVGEESGTLQDTLLSASDQMDYDSQAALLKLVSYIEPVMIVVMALVVGFIMIAVIWPIYGSYSQIGNGVL